MLSCYSNAETPAKTLSQGLAIVEQQEFVTQAGLWAGFGR